MGPALLHGAGATFPNPIYQRWFSEYHMQHPEVTIDYQSVGSGAGIRELQDGRIDFGASDGPLSDEQLSRTPFRLIHIPTVLGAVVLTYNLPGAPAGLRFPPDVLADIFLGKIRNWKDERIAIVNPGVTMPDKGITVVHRSDGSSTTFIFTDFLSKVSPEWLDTVKRGTAVNWPVGLGGKGDEGVVQTIRATEGSIGYVNFIFALANKLPSGSIRNSAGQFVTPSLESIEAAAASITNMPEDFRISITNPPGRDSYPIASYTWLLVPLQWPDANKKRAFVDFMNWMIVRGETMTDVLAYAPLPKRVAVLVREKIHDLR